MSSQHIETAHETAHEAEDVLQANPAQAHGDVQSNEGNSGSPSLQAASVACCMQHDIACTKMSAHVEDQDVDPAEPEKVLVACTAEKMLINTSTDTAWAKCQERTHRRKQKGDKEKREEKKGKGEGNKKERREFGESGRKTPPKNSTNDGQKANPRDNRHPHLTASVTLMIRLMTWATRMKKTMQTLGPLSEAKLLKPMNAFAK
ncbi:MAG: hypothetical protein FRX49_12845 [Trebouxia sp. A1-2]|nr:MAG: hypothetical protein FRX49_12845 [Trebouxia sp. A1-2]